MEDAFLQFIGGGEIMFERFHETQDVFGLSAGLPLNYVERGKVDSVLISALKQKKHIVIHGGSKQGKTSLRKKHVDDASAITVVCQNKWSLADLFTAILKKAGFRVEISTKRATEGRAKVAASLDLSAKIPWLTSAKATAAAEAERKGLVEKLSKPLELDPSDSNDVIDALRALKFDGYIVLEDFHYLPPETQNDFAFAMKAFFEISDIRFIVIGVWKEADRLASYNGDLRMRLTNINADAWSVDELKEVISCGERLLRVDIDSSLQDHLVNSCFESVAIVQEACARICVNAGVTSTQGALVHVGAGVSAPDLVKQIVLEGAGQFEDFVVNMSSGFTTTTLRMYYWIMACVLDAKIDALRRGIHLSDINTYVQARHPYVYQMASLTNALNAMRSLQGAKNVRPIILDYDTVNRRLEVMDRSFLIWKNVQTEDEIEQLISSSDPDNSGTT